MNAETYVPSTSIPDGDDVFAPGPARERLETEILPGYMTRCRWFGAKARKPKRFGVGDLVPVGGARLGLIRVEYQDGESDTYLLPLQIVAGDEGSKLLREDAGAIIARFDDGSILADAVHLPSFHSAIYELMAGNETMAGEHGRISGVRGPLIADGSKAPASWTHRVEQSNSSIVYENTIFAKLYRRPEEGLNPDAEILRFLGEQRFPHVPAFGGAIEYHGTNGGVSVLSLALGMVENDGDAWSYTLAHLKKFYAAFAEDDQAKAKQLLADYLKSAAQLGTRTGEMHVALAQDAAPPAFEPEPFAEGDGTAISTGLRLAIQQVRTLLEEHHAALEEQTHPLARKLLDAERSLLNRAEAIATSRIACAKTRTHGDYHLGQVLHGPHGFVIIDFEGEPLRSLAERRRKMSPYRDVAGMLRSFHYAAHAALDGAGEQNPALADEAEAWARFAQQAFLNAWLESTRDAVFRDPDPAIERALLDAFLLEKALYEIRYEVNNRPKWVGIPLRGVLSLLEGEPRDPETP